MKTVENQTVKYATGAVRSSDAEAWRFDLVSPIGVRRVLACTGCKRLADMTADECADQALESIYTFLAGDRDQDYLAIAARAVSHAIAKELAGDFGYCNELPYGLRAVAQACQEGQVKYSPFNWEAGMPVFDLLNHAINHIFLFQQGDASEQHLGHALWNLFGAMHSQELWQHLNQGTLRSAGCVPPQEPPCTPFSCPSWSRSVVKPSPGKRAKPRRRVRRGNVL